MEREEIREQLAAIREQLAALTAEAEELTNATPYPLASKLARIVDELHAATEKTDAGLLALDNLNR